MKRISSLLVVAGLFFLTSCETTREITLNSAGSGTMVTTTDMSALIGIAKMSGQGEKMENERPVDTVISLDKMVDSIPDLTAAEKDILKTGKLNLTMDLANDKFLTKLSFPFNSTQQLTQLTSLSQRVTTQALSKQMGAGAEGGIPGMDEMKNTMDDYFITTYSKGSIERKLDKEKYAKIESDQGMQTLKKAGDEGLPMITNVVFNLPSPAKKAEGKNVTLSEDKKKVTIKGSLEDFFDDASKMEFKIEY